ncbi:hypothetical protein KXV27_008025, partial [Aspergillus fumigatus]
AAAFDEEKLPPSPSARPRPPSAPPARAQALGARPAGAWSSERPRGPRVGAVPGPRAPRVSHARNNVAQRAASGKPPLAW